MFSVKVVILDGRDVLRGDGCAMKGGLISSYGAAVSCNWIMYKSLPGLKKGGA
jgi:hypothetical protein